MLEGNSRIVIPGIDVSHYQGEIDWPKVAQSGEVQFAFIKATDGSSGVDPTFYRNANQAQSAGILHGFYHFMRPNDVLGQIANVRKVVGDNTLAIRPLMLDVEVDTITLGQVELFLKVFPRAILYTDRAWINANVLAPLKAANAEGKNPPIPLWPIPLWLAEYGIANPDPVPWTTWTFWQYGTGRVPGICTIVDFDWFNGSLEQLQAFWKLPT